jgi:hypothetical protein
MFNQLFSRRIDNTYRGARLALWVFGLLVLMKIAIGLHAFFNARVVVETADGRSLESFLPAGYPTVSHYVLLGFANIVPILLCIVVLARYRSLIPFMFSQLLLVHLALHIEPPYSVINLVLFVLMVAGFVLSLWSPGEIVVHGDAT